jgi:replicative DNA helicase
MSDRRVFTGITQLDEATGGLKPGELVVITGRPVMGKTALATSMLINEKTTTKFFFLRLQESIKTLNPRLKRMTGWKSDGGPLSEYGWTKDAESAYDSQHKRQEIIYIKTPSLLDIQEAVWRAVYYGSDAIIIDQLNEIGKKPKVLFGKNTCRKTLRHLKSIANLIQKPIILFASAHRIIEKKPSVGMPFEHHFSMIKHVDILLHLFRWEYYGLDWDDHIDRPVKPSEAMLLTLASNRPISPKEILISYDHENITFE